MKYFNISDVRLKPGSVYYDRQQKMNRYLLSVSDDQMLYNFRAAAGLPVGDVKPMTGWDDPAGKLRGHTTGHYMSGLALAYAATGEEQYRTKLDYMVSELAKCQEAFAAGGRTKPGFLSAYDEEQFDLLEEYTPYPDIWAPYYTLDKIMSGLYDSYVLTGNKQALDIELRIAGWISRRLSRVSAEKRSRMWSMYIAGEFGGMIATLARLYKVSGDDECLRTASLFYNEKLFDPMKDGRDVLPGMHANQHIPQIIGAMETYEASGDETYLRIGENFWDIVTSAHMYVNGGVGEGEMFREARSAHEYLTEKAEESCASYNMLRLTAQLFTAADSDEEGRRRARLMDYYENTLLNHIMAGASHRSDGGTTYFMPLCPGGRKTYSTKENTCCHGTGMESRYRYMEHIFSYDEEAVYINLFVPAVLDDGVVALDMKVGADGTVTVKAVTDIDKEIRVRVPEWAGSGDSGYKVLARGLRKGEMARITFPMELLVEKDPYSMRYATIHYGPYILSGLSEQQTFIDCPAADEIVNRSDNTRRVRVKPDLVFDARGMRMIPVAYVDKEPYHVYFINKKGKGVI